MIYNCLENIYLSYIELYIHFHGTCIHFWKSSMVFSGICYKVNTSQKTLPNSSLFKWALV